MTSSIRSEDDKNNTIDTSYLLSYTRHLERQTRRLETEKQIVEGERLRLQRELNGLKAELDRLRAPPLFIGNIVEVVSEDQAIVKSSTGPKVLVNISNKINSKDLKSNSVVALNQRSFSIVKILPTSQDPFVQAMEIDTKPNITYDQIGGLKSQIEEIREIVELPLVSPELFEKVGVDPPKGILLHGPPGTGKTLIAKAVANKTNATFIRVIGSELVQKFIGEGARLVREVFEYAERHAPAIIFIDELDAIGARRNDMGTSGDREVQRTLMQLLSNLDGFDSRGDVKVIAATNRPDILDAALLRPGRFDRLIEIGPPDEEGRMEILKIHTRNMNISGDLELEYIVDETGGFTGAELKNLTVEAGMNAIRNRRDHVIWDDFLKALNKIKHNRNNEKEIEGFM